MVPLNKYLLSEIPQLKVHGRTTKMRTPFTLFWTSSGIELNFRGKELWVEVESDYQLYEPWIVVLRNGELISRQMVPQGRHKICVLRNTDSNAVNNLKILKDCQCMSGDERHLLQIYGLITDGSFEEVAPKPYKIEFIGDSLTVGEGTVGAQCEEAYSSAFGSGYYSYITAVSKHFNADFSVYAQSGWGIFAGWDNNPTCKMPAHYEEICGVITGEKNTALGAKEPYDFSTFVPDVVVINLGTNDESAFHHPPYFLDGVSYKQRLNDDGNFHPEDLDKFTHATTEFLKIIRKKNPKAHILYVFGMGSQKILPVLEQAVQSYRIKEMDENIGFLSLELATGERLGSVAHPGKIAHQEASEKICHYLEKILKV